MIAIKSLLITVLLSVLFAFQGSAQLDSISVSHHIAQLPDPEDSLVSIDVIYLDVTIYDIDFLGELVIVPYDTVFNQPVQLFKYTKQQLLDFGFLDSGNYDSTATIPLYNVEKSGNYRVEITTRNYQGANIPLLEYYYEGD